MISLIFQNHYERLQLSRSADEGEIKCAYRRMARVYHPDVAHDRERGRSAFLLIKEAYEVLRDPERRRDYDELLNASERFKARHPVRSKPGATAKRSSKTEPPSAKGPDGQHRNSANSRGTAGTVPQNRPDTRRPHRADLDAYATLEVTLEEALHGGSQKITFESENGNGSDHHFRALQIVIPPRCPAGKVLRIAGKGHLDPRTRERGHLHLTLAYARHERFRSLGANLFTSVDIYPWDGALGTMIGIPTLDGQASLKIPPGAQPWQSFRLQGQGMPDESGQRGDLIVSLKFLQPPAESPRQSALWKQLKEAYS